MLNFSPFLFIGALTLTLLEDHSLSMSILNIDHDVMRDIEEEHVEAGDFVRAADMFRADLSRSQIVPTTEVRSLIPPPRIVHATIWPFVPCSCRRSCWSNWMI